MKNMIDAKHQRGAGLPRRAGAPTINDGADGVRRVAWRGAVETFQAHERRRSSSR